MTAAFDTLDYAQQLETAGVPKAQAEIHAKALSGVLATNLVTRKDFDILDCQLNARLDGFEHRMDEFEHRVIARLDALEGRIDVLERRMDGLERRMDALENRMVALEQRIDALERRMDALERRMDVFEARLDAKLLKMSDELKLHRWMFGTLITLNIGILLKLFMP